MKTFSSIIRRAALAFCAAALCAGMASAQGKATRLRQAQPVLGGNQETPQRLAQQATLQQQPQQQQQSSSSSTISRRSATDRAKKPATGGITERMAQHFDKTPISDADLQWMRIVYRSIDLDKDENAPLYYPEDYIPGQENLFRIIMRLLANNEIPAYEFLDGREDFTDEHRAKVKDVLDRFYILYEPAKGSTEKNPKYTIDPSDVPTNEVLSYYVIERWEFDTRSNHTRSRIEALCPVLHRSGEYGGEPLRYPMFWVKMDDLRPHLAAQNIFTNDANNLATSTYDDYFTMGRYKGDIYKTRNLRNKSMMQLYPDAEKLKHAQDSIQLALVNFDKQLWVPSREELLAAREARELAEAAADTTQVEEGAAQPKEKRASRRSAKRAKSDKATKTKAPKTKKIKEAKAPKKSSSSATKSVRRRKK